MVIMITNRDVEILVGVRWWRHEVRSVNRNSLSFEGLLDERQAACE